MCQEVVIASVVYVYMQAVQTQHISPTYTPNPPVNQPTIGRGNRSQQLTVHPVFLSRDIW